MRKQWIRAAAEETKKEAKKEMETREFVVTHEKMFKGREWYSERWTDRVKRDE